MGAYYTGPEWSVVVALAVAAASLIAVLRWMCEERRTRDRRDYRRELARTARATDPLRAYLDTSISDATTPDGSPRFHPPGRHPATARLRLQLERLQEFGWGDSDIAAHIRAQLAAFEEEESVAKHRYSVARRS